MSLKGKTVFITGASRGIGLAIGLRCARDGANIVIAAKTETPHPKLEGTIHTAARDIEQAGGRALPLVVDVRDEAAVQAAIETAAATFDGLDIVVNNASAVSRTPVADTDMTVAQARIAARIDPGGSRVTQLAAAAHVTKQTAGFLVEQLENAGYVERVPDPTDRRARLVKVAARGRAAAEAALPALAEVEERWTAHLGPERMAELRETLTMVREIADPFWPAPDPLKNAWSASSDSDFWSVVNFTSTALNSAEPGGVTNFAPSGAVRMRTSRRSAWMTRSARSASTRSNASIANLSWDSTSPPISRTRERMASSSWSYCLDEWSPTAIMISRPVSRSGR